MKYALDTNVIIDILHNNAAVTQKFYRVVKRGIELVIPPFTHYEIRRGFLYNPAPTKEKAYKSLMFRYPVGNMDNEILERAAVLYAKLRRSGRTVDDVDILIAAYCLCNGYTLVTHNTRHFSGIDKLVIEDWQS